MYRRRGSAFKLITSSPGYEGLHPHKFIHRPLCYFINIGSGGEQIHIYISSKQHKFRHYLVESCEDSKDLIISALPQILILLLLSFFNSTLYFISSVTT